MIYWKKVNLEHQPYLIWNYDESGLPHEPSKLKIILRKGHFLKAYIKIRTSFQVFIYKKEGSGLMMEK